MTIKGISAIFFIVEKNRKSYMRRVIFFKLILNSTQLNSDAEVKEAIRIFQNLTSKEIEVFRYLHNIYSKTRLKENLKIERNTYKTHKRHIFEKLEVHSIEAACAWYDKYRVLIKRLE